MQSEGRVVAKIEQYAACFVLHGLLREEASDCMLAKVRNEKELGKRAHQYGEMKNEDEQQMLNISIFWRKR